MILCPATRRLDCAAQNFYRGSLRRRSPATVFVGSVKVSWTGVTNLLHGQSVTATEREEKEQWVHRVRRNQQQEY